MLKKILLNILCFALIQTFILFDLTWAEKEIFFPSLNKENPAFTGKETLSPKIHINLGIFQKNYQRKQQSAVPAAKIAILGAGRWATGAMLNTLAQIPYLDITLIARSNYNQLKEKPLLPGINILHESDYSEQILDNPDIKNLIITTPSQTHYEQVKKALLCGKNVFVEKPFTRTTSQAKELIDIAKQKNLLLDVGYVLRYDKNIQLLKKILDDNKTGQISEVVFNMQNPLDNRKIDTSLSVIYDLASHMLSIVHLLWGDHPIHNLQVFMDDNEDRANINFLYENKKITINVDRDYKKNTRNRTIIVKGEKLNINLDYLSGKFQVQNATGKNIIKEESPFFPQELLQSQSNPPPLLSELEAFLEDARNNTNTCINRAENVLWVSKAIDEINSKISVKTDGPYTTRIKNFSCDIDYAEELKRLLSTRDPDINKITLLIKDYFQRQTKIKIDSKKTLSGLAQVITELFFYIDTPSEQICKKFNLTREELIQLYNLIGNSDFLQNFLQNNSPNSNYISNIKRMLKSKETIKNFLDKRSDVSYNPIELELYIGTKCPARCKFCYRFLYNNAVDYSPEQKQGLPQLTPQQIKTIVKKFAQEGGEKLVISGGLEPFSDYAGLKAAISEAKAHGLQVFLYTNAIIPDQKEFEEIALLCDSVRISISAATGQTYQKMFGINPKIHKQVIEKVKKLVTAKNKKKAATKIGLHFMTDKDNLNEIIPFVERAHKLGVDFVNFSSDYVGTLEEFSEKEEQKILEYITAVNKNSYWNEYGELQLNFGDAFKRYKTNLERLNIFEKDSQDYFPLGFYPFVVTIDPYGKVWATSTAANPGIREEWGKEYLLGTIDDTNNLANIIRRNVTAGKIFDCNAKHMNPLGKILSLELQKIKKDLEFGIELENHPFLRFSEKTFAEIKPAIQPEGFPIESPSIMQKMKSVMSAAKISGVWYNPYNQLLTKIDLLTDNASKVTLRVNDDYLTTEGALPGTIIYDFFSGKENFPYNYKGYVVIKTNADFTINSYDIFFSKEKQMDRFVHQSLIRFFDTLLTSPDFLINKEISYTKTGPEFVKIKYEDILYILKNTLRINPPLSKNSLSSKTDKISLGVNFVEQAI